MDVTVGGTRGKHAISGTNQYKWKNPFSGMAPSHLSQFRQMQDENAKPKRINAD